MAELSPDHSPTSANLFGKLKNPRRGCFRISNSPQKRHPERSASQIRRVTQSLMARSRRTPAALNLPMPLGAFRPPMPVAGGLGTVFPGGREQELIASCVPQEDPVLGLQWQSWGLCAPGKSQRPPPLPSGITSNQPGVTQGLWQFPLEPVCSFSSGDSLKSVSILSGEGFDCGTGESPLFALYDPSTRPSGWRQTVGCLSAPQSIRSATDMPG
jgi:hypothetical protein